MAEQVNQAHHRAGKDTDYWLVTLLDQEAWFLRGKNHSYEMNVRLGWLYKEIEEWYQRNA